MSFWKNKKVLITGHTGFKGSWLSLALSKLGAKLYGYSLNIENKSQIFSCLNLEKIFVESKYGDIRDIKKLKKFIKFSKPEIIFHLAAQPLVRESYVDPNYTYEANVMGTINLFEILKQNENLKCLMVITTDKVYKNLEKKDGYKEDESLGGHDPYSASKACVEIITESYKKSFFEKNGTVVATLRAGNVIGGGDWSKDRLIPDIIKSIKSQKNLIIRSPDSVRPWQHVMEAVYFYIKISQNFYKRNRNFLKNWNLNIGPMNNKNLKVIDIVKVFKKDFPDINFEIKREKKLKETKILKLNSNKIKNLLSIKSTLSSREVLRLTIDWYKEFLNNNDLEKITNEQIKFIEKFYTSIK